MPGGLAMLNFNPSNTKPMVEMGKKDAANAIAMGVGKGFELLENYKSLDEKY